MRTAGVLRVPIRLAAEQFQFQHALDVDRRRGGRTGVFDGALIAVARRLVVPTRSSDRFEAGGEPVGEAVERCLRGPGRQNAASTCSSATSRPSVSKVTPIASKRSAGARGRPCLCISQRLAMRRTCARLRE